MIDASSPDPVRLQLLSLRRYTMLKFVPSKSPLSMLAFKAVDPGSGLGTNKFNGHARTMHVMVANRCGIWALSNVDC